MHNLTAVCLFQIKAIIIIMHVFTTILGIILIFISWIDISDTAAFTPLTIQQIT